MAEGIQMSSFNSKFFCHHCRREVSPFHIADLTCPDCSSSFLEEISKDLFEAETAPQNCDYDDDDESDLDDISLVPESFGSVDNLIGRMLLNVAENQLAEPRVSPTEPRSDSPLFRSDSFSDIIRHVNMRSILAEEEPESEFVRLRIGGGWDDYIDDEVDRLTSQLLDEVEVSGPPPLSKEQIKSLSVVSVSKEHVEKGVQCTICMEDLSVREKVKSLPCAHLYHDKCITPWLEKQATCPNCRDIVEVYPKRRSHSCPRGRLRNSTLAEMSVFGLI